MKKYFVILTLIFFTGVNLFAQNFSNLWDGHFSYFNITDVTRSETKLYAASENAIFSYDIQTNEIEKITTVQGLSGETISTIEYSEVFDIILIGYENGLIELFFEEDDTILSVVDILEKETISPENKRINDFNVNDGLVYIATNFGISIYDLDRLEFGDTYFLGNGGLQIKVYNTAIFEDAIYAACGNDNGLKKGLLSNQNLIDFSQWQTINPGNFVSVERNLSKLFTVSIGASLFEIINDNIVFIVSLGNLPNDTDVSDNTLVIALSNQVQLFNEDGNLITSIQTPSELGISFNSGLIINEFLYTGTNDLGVLRSNYLNPDDFQEIRPSGPLRNSAFKIHAINDKVWVNYGDYSVDLNPYPLRQFGMSILVEEEWINIPYDSLLGGRDFVDVAVNPFNPSQAFVNSFFNGILEFENETPFFLHDENNSGLEPLISASSDYTDLRISSIKFDRNGLLWSNTSRVRRPMKSYDPATNQWQAYDIDDVIPDINNIGFGNDDNELGFIDLDIDSNGTKWFGSFFNGLIGFNENIGGGLSNSVSRTDQNMPTTKVRAVAVDQRNQVWIGTDFGLRVLFNSAGFLENPVPEVNSIIILEDGIPKELLESQFITDIKVDGSNNKWVGTLDSGVFYFSPDGQETIYHFTKDNSPIPSNSINDISIDDINGRVYISTSRGLVSFTSGGSKPEETLDEAFVYPNPVRPEYNVLGSDNLNDINKGIKIKGLTENVNVKITDVEGNLVAEAQSRVNQRSSKANYNFAIDGGTGIWNGKNFRGNVVATGVYLVLISDLDSFETKTLKLLIVR
ncbi:ABC transporter substrate-binding protein [Ichthyenterobacterium sp. W332]|uniref:ABC transporter substrate-binding protein n=1 Tax=Microcosmobacter mediterraneus TaxID=3075607 RepID=A0ABU2YID9_9FLAO|nr:ABC transporter substrate-binding protein [Ichthyenterobacterium sp. W332]MDT0557802.1 ABC transporter substrate-binding protein [Ichthyenterobacterium sp. W332]